MPNAGSSITTFARDRRLSAVCAMAVTLAVQALSPAAAEPFVAGVEPDKRPAAAPRRTSATAQAIAAQTAGIAAPLPPLAFIKDHGGWYTPFTRPGMPGPYDIRGLHAAGASSGAARAP